MAEMGKEPTQGDLVILMKSIDPQSTGFIKYNDFINFILPR
jgi:hypothetical protein